MPERPRLVRSGQPPNARRRCVRCLSFLFGRVLVLAAQAAPAPAATTEPPSGVYYESVVRSWYDSNGDGIGDLDGVTARLDYLQRLGVSGIWLMPINPSPSYHGYDITD